MFGDSTTHMKGALLDREADHQCEIRSAAQGFRSNAVEDDFGDEAGAYRAWRLHRWTCFRGRFR